MINFMDLMSFIEQGVVLLLHICKKLSANIYGFSIVFKLKFQTSFRFCQLFHQCPFSIPGSNPRYHVAFRLMFP